MSGRLSMIPALTAAMNHWRFAAVVFCTVGSACSSDEAAIDVKPLTAESRQAVPLASLIPQTRRVCILRDWLSFEDYVVDRVAFSDARQRKQYSKCPRLVVNNPDGENRLVAVFEDRCPIIYSFHKPILQNGSLFTGNCIDPNFVAVRSVESHVQLLNTF